MAAVAQHARRRRDELRLSALRATRHGVGEPAGGHGVQGHELDAVGRTGVAARDLDAIRLPFLLQRQHARVGDRRHHEPCELARGGRQVERCRELAGRLGEEGEPPRRLLRGLAGGLLLGQRDTLLRLVLGLLGEEEEVHEHAHLRAQHLRHDRRRDVVDRAERVALRRAQLVGVIGRDEDDRDVRRALAAADQGRRLEPVEAGHVDVEQDQREVAREDVPQRLLTGGRGEDVLAKVLEDRLDHEQLVRAVVDYEDVGFHLFVAKFRDRCRIAAAAPRLATAVARYFAPD
jgi:hypothetical protein